jgi:hypothetical protein
MHREELLAGMFLALASDIAIPGSASREDDTREDDKGQTSQ